MKYRLLAIALLLIFGLLQFTTLSITSPTVDEPLHIFRGYAFVARGEDRYRVYGPVLSDALSGIALLLEPPLKLPLPDDPVWEKTANTDDPDGFIWENVVSSQQIFFLARLPIIAVSFLLGAFVFRWAAERRSPSSALGALALYVFCPNILAHARLATTDVVAAATFFVSVYTFQRAVTSTRPSACLLSGIALGLALATKFSAAALPLAYGLAIIIYAVRGNRTLARKTMVVLTTTVLVGCLTLWAIYRFKLAPLEPNGLPLPAPSFWGEWLAFSKYLQNPLPGYLFGEMSAQGWWYYYPFVFLLKTPVPLLIFAIAALILTLRVRSWKQDMLLWLPPGLFFTSLLFSPHDLGYRYLLPVLPFLFVASGDIIKAAWHARWATAGVIILLGWQLIGTLRIYPYYLTFFNEFVAGTDQGRYILSDSNIDWGQDLIGLKHYVDQHQIDSIKLSFFGVEHPTGLNLKTEALPPIHAAMSDQGAWWLHTYYPPDPAPGTYAISVANLMGGIWISPVTYAYFRNRQPNAIIGGTIYLYTIARHGTPVDIALGGLQIEQIDPNTFTRLATNDVRLRWFDASSALIAPSQPAWIAIHNAQPIAPEFVRLFEGVSPKITAFTVDDHQSYDLYFFDLGTRLAIAATHVEQAVYWDLDLYPKPEKIHRVSLPVSFGSTADLMGYELISHVQSGELTVVTYWQAREHIVTPLKMFVHVLDASGKIVAQQDLLSAAAEGWHPGDRFAQINRLSVLGQSGSLWLELGLYNPDSNERVPITVAGQSLDRLLLTQVGVK